MSTIDPIKAQRERANRRPSTRRVLLTLLVMVVGGGLAGAGWGGQAMLDVAGEHGGWITVAIILGMLISILSISAWLSLVFRRGDIGLGYGLGALLIGGGLGVLLVVSIAPENLGGSITGYGLLGAGLVLAVLGWLAHQGRRVEEARQEELMRTGREVQATVSDRGYLDFGDGTQRLITTATFTFTDHLGTQRWVQRVVVMHRSAPLDNGDTTRLWYDPQDPGDEKSIVVEAARGLRRG